MSAREQPWLHELVTVLSAPTVVLSERGGHIRAVGAQGAVHADVRVLSEAVLEIGGGEPAPVGGGLVTAARARFVSVARNLGDDIADPTVRVERERIVSPGRVAERIRLASCAEADVSTEMTLRLAADLAHIQLIKDGQAAAPVPISVLPAAPGEAGAAGEPGVRSVTGEPGVTAGLAWGSGGLQVQVRAPGAVASADADGAAVLRWQVHLASRSTTEFGWELSVRDPSAVVRAAPAGAATATWPGVRADADDPRLPSLLAQSLSDAKALRTVTARSERDIFLAAGAPWYFTLFGRDSIWAARLLLPFGWQLAAGTLRALAAFQGRRLDPASAEAPGKIPHELRRADAGHRPAGEVVPPPVYYGTIDATPLWICLLHDAWRWGMPENEVRALLPSLRSALECIRDHGDPDGDGFLEYIDESGHGLANQGWKDSWDSVRFASGGVARPPIALCEVQGYAHEAALSGADLLDALGEPGGAQWRSWAGALAGAFRASFWVSDAAGPYPALALDRDKRRVDSLTSNIGHLLGTGLLSPDEEAIVAARLVAGDMDSGFGLRTMSAASGGYSPLSYHCGSVWAHDTAIVIRGLARSGHGAAATALIDGLLAAGGAFGWRLPELFAGDPRAVSPWPLPYPASCRPQAWAAASAGALVQALLGLEVDVPRGTVRVAPPGVPVGGAGLRLHVDGLVAGGETFSAGVEPGGQGYVRGLNVISSLR
jgi:glycogen debranching enzyme